MHLRSKRTSEMCQNIGSLNGKTEQNHLKMPTLPPFIQKITAFIGKLKTLIDFFIVKKNLVWHSHNFLLPYITVEEYFIISIKFIFNLYFLCFVVDELPAFIIIDCNFLNLISVFCPNAALFM